ncbi:hypothetical protein MUK42_31926 [Musa troglodytarum]|uniref:Uncharacterized protein n=1 Tax=Musa troglodytarum TaxID=320322 RepID=A0A9E7FKL6_9LILI|nr:hypothetical protein MUK42_31926 [Musa troglodytarum]
MTMARRVKLSLLLLLAIAAAAATAVHSRDCYVGNTLLSMQDSCCDSLRRILCRNNVGVGKIQSPQTENEFTSTNTSTSVQSPQTGVTSPGVSDPYCKHSFPSLT